MEAEKEEISEQDQDIIAKFESQGFQYLDEPFSADPEIKRRAMQAFKLSEAVKKNKPFFDPKTMIGSKILMVADKFDAITAMNEQAEPTSEISAVRYLLKNPQFYDHKVTKALLDSINILVPGCTVELTNGDKGLVITENPLNVLKPVVLSFSDNSIIDLSLEKAHGHLDIKDVMKTMDNRVAIDREAMEAMFAERSAAKKGTVSEKQTTDNSHA